MNKLTLEGTLQILNPRLCYQNGDKEKVKEMITSTKCRIIGNLEYRNKPSLHINFATKHIARTDIFYFRTDKSDYK